MNVIDSDRGNVFLGVMINISTCKRITTNIFCKATWTEIEATANFTYIIERYLRMVSTSDKAYCVKVLPHKTVIAD